ncbi:MAG: S-layer homology domain-containing protein [Syntrophomonadaceae bacterium]
MKRASGSRTFLWAIFSMGCATFVAAQTIPRSSLLPTARHAPDEFGTGDYTVTTISAMSFTPLNDGPGSTPYYTFNLSRGFTGSGAGFCLGSGELGEFYTTIDVPSGAVIDYVGLETASDVDFSWGISLWLVDRYGSETLLAAFSSTAHGWDSDYNLSPLGFQLARNVHNMLVLNVEEAGNGNSCPAFRWIEIWWKRTVSPAPGSPSFNDVPPSDPAFQFIEALVASGITAGCGGGNYCPDAPLTRRQMAVFLSKALGLHWPY